MRTAPRRGLRALMAAAGWSPRESPSDALGFRLAPRINAAGRLYRADAGVELMLTDDPARAAAIAAELDKRQLRAPRDRARGRRRRREGASAAAELADAPALVLAGGGWHPGVVGIAASRLAERHWKPVVLLSIDGDAAADRRAASPAST